MQEKEKEQQHQQHQHPQDHQRQYSDQQFIKEQQEHQEHVRQQCQRHIEREKHKYPHYLPMNLEQLVSIRSLLFQILKETENDWWDQDNQTIHARQQKLLDLDYEIDFLANLIELKSL